MPQSKSSRPLRKFWGWGNDADQLLPMEVAIVKAMMARLGCAAQELPAPPGIGDFTLPAARIAPPASLADAFFDAPHDRLSHAYGKSFADAVRMWNRDVPEPPDWVVFTSDEREIEDVLDWAARENVAVIPYGGGSSMCGGVEPAVGTRFMEFTYPEMTITVSNPWVQIWKGGIRPFMTPVMTLTHLQVWRRSSQRCPATSA